MPPCLRVPSRRVSASRTDATVPARPQPPYQRQPCRRHRACAAPAVRITNHESRVTNHGHSGPPLCGGTPPATPPCSDATVPARPQPPSQRQPYRRHRACAAPAVRITNHESRITNHGRSGPRVTCAGGLPPQRPPVGMPPCLRVPSRRVSASRTDATVPARRPQFESRVTSHESRTTAVPALPCAGGLPPQRPPVANATVPARRPQFESRITSHESRTTAVPALPCAGGLPPQRPPVANATVPARRPQFESRVTNHESRITAVPALPCAGGLPPQRPPVTTPPAMCRI